METLFTAIERLGLPIVTAAVLIWHFLKINKQLTDHNRELLAEIGELRQIVSRALQENDGNERILRQNEILVEMVNNRERASHELARNLVDVIIMEGGGKGKNKK